MPKTPAADNDGLKESLARKYPSADKGGPDGFKLTDLGNAERLVSRHGANIMFCHPRKTWYVWNGKYWEADETGAVERLAHETIRSMYADCASGRVADAKALAKWAANSEAHVRIAAMVAEARNIAFVLPRDLDDDPWLFNCENGVLDLRTATLLPHDRARLITKCSPVSYEPNALCDTWDEFLMTSTQDNYEIINFLARAVGYTLTGSTREEAFFFIHGVPGTGKSTFLDAVRAVLGPYGITADFDSLVMRQHAGGVRDDIACLLDKRMVTSIEVEDGRRLAEGLVANITGGDSIRARELYQKSQETRPQFKLWIAANNEPIIHGNNSPIWRRVVRIPFEHVVPEAERDGSVKALFQNDADARAAVLAWAVRGCLDWQVNGLAVPDALKIATAQYRDNQNVLKDFIEDRCVVGGDYRGDRDEIYPAYDSWCEEQKLRPKERLNRTTFVKRLSAQFPLIISGKHRIFNGIGLKSEYESQQSLGGL